MTVLKILTFPDPFLTKKAKPVVVFDDTLKREVDSIIETLYASESGIGLAATQVGIDLRVFVMDVQYRHEDPEVEKKPIVVINPEIIEKNGEMVNEEGCLSVPGFRAEVKRAERVILRYQDLSETTQLLEAEGLLAICIQHEFDHLNGKLFIDHLPPLRRKIVKTKLKKVQANRVS